MLANLLALTVSLCPLAAQDPVAPAKTVKPEAAKAPEPIEAVFERMLAAKNDADIQKMMTVRSYEVIGLVDGYLESWLTAQEHPEQAKDANPERMLELALAAAKWGDATFKVDAYSRYANAWKGWTAEQRLQFRDGQMKFSAGREAMKAKKLEDAKTSIGASLKLATELGDLWGMAQAEQSLGDLCAGEYAAETDATKKQEFLNSAIQHQRKAAQTFGSLRHPGVLRSLRALGNLCEKNGDLKSARSALERMMQVASEARRLDNTGPVKQDLARICRALGDEAAAKKWES